ncbi:MAG: 1-deoxy-D-xylulose-5-phosphate reductoisomerase [Clostridia bacterium]|nr:1-deoxy-D-xylulose-5-phosphate reductoisomerase [Clostridia bacterium]
MRSIAILGATGSIGTQALDIIDRHPERFRAAVLTARSDWEGLFRAVRKFRPQAAGLVEEPPFVPEDLRGTEWFFGGDCSRRALEAVRPDDALAAVVGVAGLDAVLAALKCCRRVLLANKEALVTGGHLVKELAAQRGVPLLPVDSEHSAIFQCLEARGDNEIARLILTCSGGPFRTWERDAIDRASVSDVLRHPTWRMGSKITVDCATLMNKGLEVIEAHHLFGMPESRIDVVVHPESIIHSMVEFEDGAVLAQLGVPDMRTAIGYAMGYPERVPYGGERLDFAKVGTLSFGNPDPSRFPCYRLAREALQSGDASAPVALNGANEAAVAAFLDGRIGFGGIARIVEAVMNRHVPGRVQTAEDVYGIDRNARRLAQTEIERILK